MVGVDEQAYRDERGMFLKRFGANLRRIRRDRGREISQEDLAMLAGLHRTEIGKLEQGVVEPKLSTLLILAESLQVSLDELVGGLPAPRRRKPAPGGRRGASDGEGRDVGGP